MLEEFKKAVIREDYVLLTGNYISALILNQFVYWTKRVYDHDKFVKEELVRLKREDQTASFPLRSGWIYKTASQLNNELMLDVSDATIHKYLNVVLEMGLIDQRNNPNHKWDRTLQYRVNLAKLHVELVKIGSGLEGFKTLTDEIATLTDENAFSEFENGVSESENRSTKNLRALPEINTDIKIENTKDIAANAAPPPPPMPVTNGKHALKGSSGSSLTPPVPTPPPSQNGKPKKEPSQHQQLMAAYQDALGYKIPNGAQEGKGASKILKAGYTIEQVVMCYEYMKRDSFWQAKHLSLMSIHKQLGAFLQAQNGNGRTDDIDNEWQSIKIAAGQPGKPAISENALKAVQGVPGGWRRFKEQDARFFDQLKPLFKEAYERANQQQPATA